MHGSEQENNRRRYIEERYRLLPYLYTTAEEMSRTGLPIVRPLFLEFPNATSDNHPLDIDVGNQFLFGPDLMVAPAPYPDSLKPYEVQLPPGDWYDYWTGAKVASAGKDQRYRGKTKPGYATGLCARRHDYPHATPYPEHQRSPAGTADLAGLSGKGLQGLSLSGRREDTKLP